MTDVTVSRSIKPNFSKLHEELDALTLGAYGLLHPRSYPGDIIARFNDDLTSRQQTDITNIISNHDPNSKTTEQRRKDQDIADLDAILADYNIDPTTWTFADNEADILALLKFLCRCVCRIARNEEI